MSSIWDVPPSPGRGGALGAAGIAVVAGVAAMAGELSPTIGALVLAVVVMVASAFGGVAVAIAVALGATVVQVLLVVPSDQRGPTAAGAALGFGALALGVASLAHWGRSESDEADEAGDDVAELEERHEQRTALLRSVSHDLRTPLGAIRSVATDLRDGVAYDDATRHELLVTVCDEVDRLDRMVANLLSMSRIEAGVIEPERQAVDLEELALERAAVLAPLFRDVRLHVDVPDEVPWADVDYSLISEVLTNLLGNAARYAPPGSNVWIVGREHLDPDGRATGMVQVSVIDEGPGVADEDRERIFEAFQHESWSRTSGLGLTICRGYVEAHGGRVWLEPTPGPGATFCFTVPGIVEEAPAEQAAEEPLDGSVEEQLA